MNTAHEWLSSGSVTAVVSGVVAWLLAHRTGLVALARNLAKAAAGGSVTVQQVSAAVEAVDPGYVDSLKAKVEQLLDEKAKAAEDWANMTEAEVQKRVQSELESLLQRHAAAVAVPPEQADPVPPVLNVPVSVSVKVPADGSGVDQVDVSQFFPPQ